MDHKSQPKTRMVPETTPRNQEQTGTLNQRLCADCAQPIPEKRLSAQPNARLCVPCLEAAGDVTPIKRFDDVTGDGERVEILFTNDRRIERQITRSNHIIANEEAFNIVVGDDSHLGHEGNEIMDGARSLATVFEDLEDPANVRERRGLKVKWLDKPDPVGMSKMAKAA